MSTGALSHLLPLGDVSYYTIYLLRVQVHLGLVVVGQIGHAARQLRVLLRQSVRLAVALLQEGDVYQYTIQLIKFC